MGPVWAPSEVAGRDSLFYKSKWRIDFTVPLEAPLLRCDVEPNIKFTAVICREDNGLATRYKVDPSGSDKC